MNKMVHVNKIKLKDYQISLIITLLLICFYLFNFFTTSSGLGGISFGVALFVSTVLISFILGSIHIFFIKNLKDKFIYLLLDSIIFYLLIIFFIIKSIINNHFGNVWVDYDLPIIIYLVMFSIFFIFNIILEFIINEIKNLK